MKIYSFEKLEVYQVSRELTKQIYELTRGFPNEERFGLTNQIRRASVSICLNLAEGTSRISSKEKIRYLEISYGSLMEVVACIHIATDLGFTEIENVEKPLDLVYKISNMINGLKRHFEQSESNKTPSTL